MIASGFKSFADKITIDLTSGITGIVGPNGSGKSNVVDAIRWVLGEQSVKSLRGEGTMTDVIFSGSKSRNAMNVASVTLVFDNQDHYLKLPYDEVAIRRRVYKDGTNEYFLNNEKCRLKDITDLFLDSGVAKESFNIISQGKIEEIINSKPSDRRVIFEEAASVLKYKKRKDEALRKLEKTKENMDRVEDIIRELEHRVIPLKEQRDKALKYQDYKEELKEIEVSLMVRDITAMNSEYGLKKKTIEQLNQNLVSLTATSSSSEAKIEAYKSRVSAIEEQLATLQHQLITKTKDVEKINSQKAILVERKKYEVEDVKLHNQQLELKEQIFQIENGIASLNQELEHLDGDFIKAAELVEHYRSLLQENKESRGQLEQILTKYLRTKAMTQTQMEELQERIEHNSSLPTSVKAILNHPKLNGVHNALGSLLEIEERYSLALTTSLGSSSSFLIVDDEIVAKTCISYLKDQRLGRATFFPLNIIQPKTIDKATLEQVEKMEGFVGVASTLAQFQPLYRNVVENQLGNVLVADTIDHANLMSKAIHHRYRVVTLDGELLHVGGSITGGTIQKSRTIITEKYELEHKLKSLEEITNHIQELEMKLNEKDDEHRAYEDKLYLADRDRLHLQEELQMKKERMDRDHEKLLQLKQEEQGTEHLLNQNFDVEEETILKAYYAALKERDSLEQEVEQKKKEQLELKEELEEYERNLRQENSMVFAKNRELKELEIEVNRLDVKLDNLLVQLNESYHLTYEKALTMYQLELEESLARNKVSELKRWIRELGNVNLDAIEEYQEVSERYEFLIGQKNDLLTASATLIEIMEEMDQVMSQEFLKTFQVIQKNFKETFQELFRGGTAELKLTDPEHILETGIDIIASPPGKKLTSISLLSGGEKTFTAISLLFAILKSRPVPYCILDEVEAALDEVNVDSFGHYLKNLNAQTQFLLITHKKRTMEYVDVLYGITMQESGVSKLVSVKLEEVRD